MGRRQLGAEVLLARTLEAGVMVVTPSDRSYLDIAASAPTPHLALQRLLVFLHAGPLLDRHDDVRTPRAEPFEIQVLDELREGQLPGFLDCPSTCRLR